MKAIHDFLIFASDAKELAVLGVAFLLLAGFASYAERRRVKRARIDRVGWVPWTGIFLACVVIGGGLIALAGPALIKG
ncbi:MAG: hypothetical protein R3E18_09875 [Sphingomonadaceae bacterium]|nr:hypothetical protein [Sphingomonadaceae bacterium]